LEDLEGWAAVKVGMSHAQVVEILGEPKSTDVVIDRQTLFYKDGAAAPIGTVVITDDRVSEVISTVFQIHIPRRNKQSIHLRSLPLEHIP